MDGGNPYARMVSVMRGEAAEQSAQAGSSPVKMRLGRVTGRTPLSVQVAGTAQPAEALKLNERLAKGAKWKARITGAGEPGAIGEAIVEQLEIDLEVGDTVLLLTEDDQMFYIVMKVVNAV